MRLCGLQIYVQPANGCPGGPARSQLILICDLAEDVADQAIIQSVRDLHGQGKVLRSIQTTIEAVHGRKVALARECCGKFKRSPR